MRAFFILLALLLIVTGGVLLFVPREEPRAQTRGLSPQVVSLAVRARDLAEQVNAPLSILFGLASLYYSRRRYFVERNAHANDKT